MTDPRILKVRAQAEHLLDLFILLREKYAMLRPLAFDSQLATRIGGGPKARGRIILKNTLLEGCVADVVKLALDMDPRTPSARNLMAALEDSRVRDSLLEDYATVPPMPFGDNDPLSGEIVADIQTTERSRLVSQFHTIWSDLSSDWRTLVDDSRLSSFKVWRDKRIAHSELHHSDGEYLLIDLSLEGLKWSDLGELISRMQGIVDKITALTRGASFDWEMLDEQLASASEGFWSLLGNHPDHAAKGV